MVEVAGVCEMTRGRVEQLKGDISMVVGTTSSSCPWEKFISRNFVVNGLLFMYYLQPYLILIFRIFQLIQAVGPSHTMVYMVEM